MVYRAGLPTPLTGIYRCDNCGHEVPLSRGEKFPPCRCGEADWDNVREDVEAPRRNEKRAGPRVR